MNLINNSPNKKYILIAVTGISIIGGIIWYINSSQTKEILLPSLSPSPSFSPPQQIQQNEVLARLEQEIGIATQSGGINPELYDEIDQKLQQLENQYIEPERTARLRTQLGQLQVGGRQKETAKKTISTNTSVPNTLPTLKAPISATSTAPIVQKPSCVSNPNPVFSRSLVDPDSVNNILPPPNRPKSDLTVLKTHSYINTSITNVPIYAPIDMELIDGAHYIGGPYSLDFRVSCEVTLRLAHITSPVQKIKDALPKDPVENSHDVVVAPTIPFKAGDLIGYVGGPPYTLAVGFDFGVYNSSLPNRFATEPEKYTSRIYTTAVCPFDYFTPEIRNAYRSKYYLLTHEGMQYDLPHFCQ